MQSGDGVSLLDTFFGARFRVLERILNGAHAVQDGVKSPADCGSPRHQDNDKKPIVEFFSVLNSTLSFAASIFIFKEDTDDGMDGMVNRVTKEILRLISAESSGPISSSLFSLAPNVFSPPSVALYKAQTRAALWVGKALQLWRQHSDSLFSLYLNDIENILQSLMDEVFGDDSEKKRLSMLTRSAVEGKDRRNWETVGTPCHVLSKGLIGL